MAISERDSDKFWEKLRLVAIALVLICAVTGVFGIISLQQGQKEIPFLEIQILSLLVSILMAFIVGYQAKILNKQTEILDRQLEIIELEKRPMLTFKKVFKGRILVELIIKNVSKYPILIEKVEPEDERLKGLIFTS